MDLLWKRTSGSKEKVRTTVPQRSDVFATELTLLTLLSSLLVNIIVLLSIRMFYSLYLSLKQQSFSLSKELESASTIVIFVPLFNDTFSKFNRNLRQVLHLVTTMTQAAPTGISSSTWIKFIISTRNHTRRNRCELLTSKSQ